MYNKEINRVAVGTYELKRVYQRNMLIAMLFIIVLTAAVIGSVTLANANTQSKGETLIPTDTVIIDFKISPPPTVETEPVKVTKTKKIDFESVISGIEVAGDEEIEYDPVLTSKEELKDLHGDPDGDDLNGVVIGNQIVNDYIPPEDTFIAVEVFPILIHRAQPRYPEIARKAGIEGAVTVNVLVDLDGSVMDAKIFAESRANAGFEKAALEAARNCKFTPAMQNNQPIRVWVTYTIEFRLK